MKVLIVEDNEGDKNKIMNFVEEFLTPLSKQVFPELFGKGLDLVYKHSKEEVIKFLQEDPQIAQDVFIAFIDLYLPLKRNSNPTKEHGLSLLDEINGKFPTVIVSSYLLQQNTYSYVLQKYGNFCTIKDKESLFKRAQTKNEKNLEAQSILIFALYAHPIYKHAINIKKYNKEEKIDNLAELSKKIADYYSLPSQLLPFSSREIKSYDNTKITVNVKSEFSALKAVIIHTPGKEIENIGPSECETFLMDQPVNFETFKRQYEDFKNILQNSNITLLEATSLLKDVLKSSLDRKIEFVLELLKIEKLPPYFFDELCKLSVDELISLSIEGFKDGNGKWIFKPIPNLMFTRDWGFVIHDKVFVFNTEKDARRKEKIIGEFIFRYHEVFKDKFISIDFSPEETIEGGDVIHLNEKIIIMGLSDRTKLSAIRKISEKLIKETQIEKVIVTQAPLLHRRSMHLDTYIAVIEENTILAFSKPLKDEEQVFYVFEKNKQEPILKWGKFSEIIKEESGVEWEIIWIYNEKEFWEDACNIFSISPRNIIIYKRAQNTIDALAKKNYTLKILDGYELVLARGGPHCMTLPIWRENEEIRNRNS